MPKQSAVIRLRNRMSEALFKYKEDIGSVAYEKLYEELKEDTKSEIPDRVLVTITYVKAKTIETCDDDGDRLTFSKMKECSRNLFIWKDMYEITQKILKEKKSFPPYSMVPGGLGCDESKVRCEHLKTQMDEEYLFNGIGAQFLIIDVKLLE